MILSKVADPTYRSCYPQDAEWSQVHQGRVLVALGVWASAQPADVRRFPPRDAVVARPGWGTSRRPRHDGCGGGEVIVGALSTCAGAAAGQGGGGSS